MLPTCNILFIRFSALVWERLACGCQMTISGVLSQARPSRVMRWCISLAWNLLSKPGRLVTEPQQHACLCLPFTEIGQKHWHTWLPPPNIYVKLKYNYIISPSFSYLQLIQCTPLAFFHIRGLFAFN